MNKGLIITGLIATFIIGFILGFKLGKFIFMLIFGFNTALYIIGTIAILTLIGYLYFKFNKSKV
jgi:hypothetical protein